MTRDEEVRNAIDKMFPCSNKGRTYEQAIAASGFELGVQWADKHPINVWHDASKEPMNDKEPILLYSNDLKKTWILPVSEIHNIMGEVWYAYVILSKVTKWAYLDELLKGGEE